jgi:DNA-directed RNA polymerase III subunit RPC1
MQKETIQLPDTSKQITAVRFIAGGAQFIKDTSQLEIFNNKLYEDIDGKHGPAPFGPLDLRLGTSLRTNNCQTCGQNMVECIGHFGHIDLEVPVFHIGFFRLTIKLLQCVCKECGATLLSGQTKQKLLAQISSPNLDYLKRKALHKKIVEMSKKISNCPECDASNGVVKKASGSVMKIAHAKYLNSTQVNIFVNENPENSSSLLNMKYELLNPEVVLNIFQRIRREDYGLVMVRNDKYMNPCDLLVTRIAVPPVCIRPSVVTDFRAGSNEDDITMKLTEIMLINDVIKKHKKDGAATKTLTETWDHLQIQCALYINSELNGLPLEMQPKKFIRSFTQRLKGKQGRFRGNLSGKRVDFSGRTVISPDPNLKIDQVGVPVQVAKILTFPEVVNKCNIEKLRQLVINGDENHPGATHIVEGTSGRKKFLKYGDRKSAADNLRLGDVVERHLQDNDIVLFNRQPSLHKISIMAHRAKVMPHRTFRFNECACTPYNADFDGDEMNLHLPQTYEAKAEAAVLMGLKYNLITPRSGEPLIAAIQDFISAGYLMTLKDTFLQKVQVMRLAAALMDRSEKHQQRLVIPKPAIISPIPMWTGKQIVELILNPYRKPDCVINLTTKNKSYSKNEEFCPKDGYIIIRKNKLLAGCLDKTLLGSGSKTSIFYTLLRDVSEDAAIEGMWRLARMSPVFMSMRGMTLGIGDVKPTQGVNNDKAKLLQQGYSKVDTYISEFNDGTLKPSPGRTPRETLESLILRELSAIRDYCGSSCLNNLPSHNSPLTMAVCGSKGSFINVSQMIACVGQQAISGNRPADGFPGRSLPLFDFYDDSPVAKGFVENSFFTGLIPAEFFFHTMAGREGLVDTAVKTAETGYMQRRLVKCLEDLASNYDGTVRTSTGEIVQFIFGEDGLDPACMEAKSGAVVDFEHVLEHIKAMKPYETEEPRNLEAMIALIDIEIKKQSKILPMKFLMDLKEFIFKKITVASEEAKRIHMIRESDAEHIKKYKGENQAEYVARKAMTATQLGEFVDLCLSKARRAVIEPGTAVGAIAATSIGEPSTQMTLKTFHFAGVASMNITQGVPRIKEIINAVRQISTPVISVELSDPTDEVLARRVKARIEKTTLGEVSKHIEQVFMPDDCFVEILLDAKRILLLQLEVTPETIAHSIATAKLPVIVKPSQVEIINSTLIVVRPPQQTAKMSFTLAMHYLKYHLASVVIKGLPNVQRCLIHADEKTGKTYKLLAEGTDFKQVMAIPNVNTSRTTFNNALVIAEVLGIEAARKSIIDEITATMESHGITLDQRHIMLLADLMTFKGEVLGITRNGLVKMKESVFLLASFERTTDHLYEAAFYGQKDKISGVSECIITGNPISIGTGMFKILTQGKKERTQSSRKFF